MRPIRRIQRNACPSDDYKDGSAVRPTGPERSSSAYNAVRSSDTNAKESTVKPKEPERSGSSANAVERSDSRTDNAYRRMRMKREALTPENVHTADTVSLLPERADTLSAKYEGMRVCNENYKVHNLNFSSPEIIESDADRITELRQTNLSHERWMDSTIA